MYHDYDIYILYIMVHTGKNVKYLYLKKYLNMLFQQNTVYIFWGPLKKLIHGPLVCQADTGH